MINIKLYIIQIIILSIMIPASLMANCDEEILNLIFSVDKDIQDFQADFYQKHKTRVFAEPKVSEGVIYIKFPDLFKIYTEKPSREIMILKEGFLINYDVEKEIRRERKISSHMDEFRLFYLFNITLKELKQNYFVRCISIEDGYRINLAPKSANIQRRLLNIIITVIREDLIIRNISYYLRNEEEVHISFSNIKVNEGLSHEIFDL